MIQFNTAAAAIHTKTNITIHGEIKNILSKNGPKGSDVGSSKNYVNMQIKVHKLQQVPHKQRK